MRPHGTSLPANFPELPWQQTVLRVHVYDPVHARDATAFLAVESIQTTELPAVPALSSRGLAAHAAALVAAVAVGGRLLVLRRG